MGTGYKPNMAGFSARLGLRNGIEELLNRPVPQQEVLYYREGDLVDAEPVSQYNNAYSRKRRRRNRR